MAHRYSQLRLPTSNTKLQQVRSLRRHSHHHPSTTKPHLSLPNILNLPILQVLTPQLHLHPHCPSSPKNQHRMALLLRAIHQMSAHRLLTCHPLADLLLLSTGRTLACMRLLLLSGQTLGHHQPIMPDTNHQVQVGSLILMVTPGLHPTVATLE